MRILYLDWPCFGKEDTLLTFEELGHEVISFFHKDYQQRDSADFDSYFEQLLNNTYYDCCFSFNFYPVISKNCQKFNIKYISVIYDSPYVMLYSYTLINPVNYVFHFDSQEYLKLKKGGISTIYYHPLPASIKNLPELQKPSSLSNLLSAEVSFVGSLYHESNNFFDRLTGINSYTAGYLDAIMEAQLKVHGYNFIEEVLTPDIITELRRIIPYDFDTTGVETPEYVFANYFINRKLTAIERRRILTAAANVAPIKLFTLDRNISIPNIQNMGTVEYYSEAPYVFANSKINLNISLRSIQSGIPLRAMDIMGAGGFLLTNFQPDFLDYFIPNEDFVYYENEEDLCEKINFYLTHEEERKEIAHNGYETVKANHSFKAFFTSIFSIVSPQEQKKNCHMAVLF